MRRRPVPTALGLICSLGPLSWPAIAAPDDRRRVEVAADECPASTTAEIRRIVGVEIGDLLIESPEPVPPERDRIVVECSRDLANLRVRRLPGEGQLGRRLPLDGYPTDSQPRVIALAGLELLASVSPEVRRRIEVGPRPPEPIETGSPPDSRLRVLVTGIRRSFLSDGGLTTWGGGLKLEGALGPRVGFGVDLDAGGSRGTTALGDVSGLLASMGARLELRGSFGGLLARAGLGGRVGVARFRGEPFVATEVSGQSILRPWAGPAVAGEIVFGRGRACVALALEAGVAAWGARGTADASTALAVSGPWVAVSLAAGAPIPIR